MKKILFAVLALLVSVGLANLAVAEVYSVRDSSDGGYEIGIEHFEIFKKIDPQPEDINPKLTRLAVFNVFELNRKGEKYLHKGLNDGETTLLSIIPPKTEILTKEYELSILENGKWDWKLLQPRKTANKQVLYVCLIMVFFGIVCMSISERLWLRGIKRLLFFYLMILVAGYLMLSNPTNNNIAYVVSIIGFAAAVVMLTPDEPSEKALFLFNMGWFCCFLSGAILLVIFSTVQEPYLHLLLSQWMAFIGASIITAFFIGELGYQIKKRLDKANAMLTEIPSHEDS